MVLRRRLLFFRLLLGLISRLFMFLFHLLLHFFFYLFFHLFLGFLFLFFGLFLRRFSLSVGRLNWTLTALFVACWNWSRNGFFDLGWLLCCSWSFRGIMSWLSMFRLLVTSMFFLLLMMLLSLFLLLSLDGFSCSFLISDNALIVDIGGTHPMSYCCSRLGLHVLIGWVLI
jgi:hypothetical protein